MTDFKAYGVPPEGMDLLRRYVEMIDNLRAEIATLQTRYETEVNIAHAKAREEMRPLWFKLAAMTGIDAAATWDSPEWGVERRYMEADFGALIFQRQQRHPVGMIMPQQDSEPEPDPTEEGPPPGVTVQ